MVINRFAGVISLLIKLELRFSEKKLKFNQVVYTLSILSFRILNLKRSLLQ